MKRHTLQFQQVYLSQVDTSEIPQSNYSNYRRINQMRNSLLISLQKPYQIKNTSFILEHNELPKKQRRNSFQEGATGKKLAKLNCYYPSTICAQHHQTQKLKQENKATLRKAVKKASIMMSTVKYWKIQSNKKIEVPPMIKSLHQRNSCLSDRNLLTARCTKLKDQPLVVLNQYRIKNNERLLQYSRDRTADKTKSVSHHASTPLLNHFSTRYSIQNVHIRVKQ